MNLHSNIRRTSWFLWNYWLKPFRHWTIDFRFSCSQFFGNLQRIELRFSKSEKPLLFWVLWFVSIVVKQNIIIWIKFYGKFRFSRHWPVQSSEVFEKNHSDFHTEGNHNNSECFFCALQLWFLELSWCEALSLNFQPAYYVNFFLIYLPSNDARHDPSKASNIFLSWTNISQIIKLRILNAFHHRLNQFLWKVQIFSSLTCAVVWVFRKKSFGLSYWGKS